MKVHTFVQNVSSRLCENVILRSTQKVDLYRKYYTRNSYKKCPYHKALEYVLTYQEYGYYFHVDMLLSGMFIR